MNTVFTRRHALSLAAGGAAAGCAAPSVKLNDAIQTPSGSLAGDAGDDRFRQFATAPETPLHRYGFKAWSDVLSAYVIDVGPPDRFAPAPEAPQTGTRFVEGHDSRYRTEGNRIPFSLFREEDAKIFADARGAIERLPETAALSGAGWLDQMAFWFNLHNACVIEQIAKQYPVKYPKRMQIGDMLFDDAKLVRVAGVPLSLKEIRVNIVYRYWRHPAAIYGFFHGIIGGPSIQSFAFEGNTLHRQLARPAGEFINSLRGVRNYNQHTAVSGLYDEARMLFPNFDEDLRRHLLYFAKGVVAEGLAEGNPLRLSDFEPRVADLAGGDIYTSSSVAVGSTTALSANPSATSAIAISELNRSRLKARLAGMPLPPSAARMLSELQEKQERLAIRSRRRSGGTVIIEDLPTDPQF